MKTKEKLVYLTFDDGPTPVVTDKILDLLAVHNAKATFFCLGSQVEKHPELYQRILAEGHSVGNHGYMHLDGWKTTTQEYLDNVRRGSMHIKSRIFRPPYGRITQSQSMTLRNLYKIVLWDLMPGDFDERVDTTLCLDRIRKNIRPGSVLVLHDNLKVGEKVVEVLKRLMDYFEKEGWKCSRITSSHYS
jgi:peptidoglycan/xylan/chitin deacetylase (PgdA/CDA1 family)